MFKFQGILLFSENPKPLADFYQKVLEQEPTWSGGEYVGFVLNGVGLIIGPHDKVKGKNSNPERIMLNLESEDVEGESKRVKELGAKVIAEPYHPEEEPEMWLSTFEDPDGNYFQIGSPVKL